MAMITNSEIELQMHSSPVKTAVSASKVLSNDRDASYLARMGKQQVMKRNFGFMSMVGLTCTLMSTWEGVLVVFAIGYQNGGSAGLIYGFLVIWAGTTSVFAVMGELASMIPTAGGQYHWVFLLAPKNCRKILSYVTGWLTCIGWIASVAATCLFCSSLIQGLIVENSSVYTPKPYQETLICWAAILLTVFVNIFVSGALPKVEGFILIIHIVGFFAVLIPLTYLGPRGNTNEIFTSFVNGGGWSTQGLSFLIGLAGNSVAFLGADGAVHMSEEIKNPRTNVPRAMIASIFINGILAFGMLLATLYCAGDLDQAFASPTGYPFIEIFTQATGSTGGATAMASIVVVTAFCNAIGAVAAASRQLWAFSRDRGVPGWSTLRKINTWASIPLAAIVVVTIVPCLLALINIGSATVFNDILSLVLAGLFCSYEMAAVLLLYHRCTGGVHIEKDNDPDISSPLEKLTWGPWRIKGALGIANNVFACVWLIVIVIFSFFPPTAQVVPATMNYSVLVFGAVVIFSIIYYLVWAKRFYTGPVIEA